MEWVSVETMKPDTFGWYMVSIRAWVTMAWFDIDGWSDFASCAAKSEQVTHWAKLPPPPKED